MTHKALIVYCSPSGSTRHVANLIETVLAESSADVHSLDIGRSPHDSGKTELFQKLGPGDILFLGSPVYRDVAVPPVMAFLQSLPSGNGCFAVPFVTWGAACSGVALWQMGQALESKGFKLAGGLKVMGRHSMMWQSDEPAGAGHPDDDDDRIVREFVQELYGRLSSRTLLPVDLSVLDYQPENHASEMKLKVGQPWKTVPKTVDEQSCTQCGQCVDECPVETIVLDPCPVIGSSCFDCFNCIRICPEAAIVPAVSLDDIAKHIMKRVATLDEKPPTCAFGG